MERICSGHQTLHAPWLTGGSGETQVLLTDTVGFIQKLPTQLVAAFRATLEEISDAALLLHVVDVSHPGAAAQAETVKNVSCCASSSGLIAFSK